jgi:hypothetical protein
MYVFEDDDVRLRQTVASVCKKISLVLTCVTLIDIEDESKSMSLKRPEIYIPSHIDKFELSDKFLIFVCFLV